MAPVEAGGEKYLQADAVQGLRSPCTIRRGLVEIASHDKSRIDGTLVGSFEGLQRVHALVHGQRHAEAILNACEHFIRQHGLDSNAANTLHIAVASQRQLPRVLRADHSPHEGEVADPLDVVDAVAMVRHPHPPGKNRLAGLNIEIRHALDVLPVEPAAS